MKFQLNGRKLAKISKFAQHGQYGEKVSKRTIVEVQDEKEANLVSSLTSKGLHRPVLDLDFPCQLVESSTPGHYHLYLETEMGWSEYDELLECLTRLGLLEQGFYTASQKEKQTYVRPPWVKKELSEGSK